MLFSSDDPFRGSWHGALPSGRAERDALIQQAFGDLLPWGLGVNIDLFHCDPARVCDTDGLQSFVLALYDTLGMPHSGDPLLAHFSEEREAPCISLVQVLGKSLLWGHFLEGDAAVCLHLFAGDPYPPYQTAAFCQQWFAARDVNVLVQFRGPQKAAFGYLFAEEGEH
ncbi:MAG: S-adenosylmethionine decarboxylase [Ktedonobacteraceae bacterium]